MEKDYTTTFNELMSDDDHWIYDIPGTPVTKKNSQRIVTVKLKTGKTKSVILPSKQYEAYRKSAVAYLQPQTEHPINFPVILTCRYYMPTHRQVDLANLIEATQDILVEAGILADDCRDIVAGFGYCRVYYDKEYPRVHICIDRDIYPDQWREWPLTEVKPADKKKSLRTWQDEEEKQHNVQTYDDIVAEEHWSTALPEG